MERVLRIVPLLMAGGILVAAAEAPMASLPGPTRSPQAKKITLAAGTQCRMLPFQFDLSKPAIVKVATSTGIYCASRFTPKDIVLKKFRVEKQPKNGVLNVNEKDQRWYYRARKGYKGQDFFVLSLEGYDRIKWGSTKMIVYVDVK